ncbi:unnamed protein product [Peniophora sp. CBMAI 1063]|nr:unnamed protein product [Peniophora sp. CBMAI 1063]
MNPLKRRQHDHVVNSPSPRSLPRRITLLCFACTLLLLAWGVYRRGASPITAPTLVLEHSAFSGHQPSILSPNGFAIELSPENRCLGAEDAWVPETKGVSSSRKRRASGRVDLRKGVRTVYVDTGLRKAGLDARLHVRAGSGDHAKVDVVAEYHRPDALEPIRACAYQADLSSGIPGQAQEMIDVFRLQRGPRKSDYEGPVSLNVTLTLPDDGPEYRVKVDAGYIVDVVVNGDVLLRSFRLSNSGASINGYPPARGRLEMREGFTAHEIEVETPGIQGYARADGHVRLHTTFDTPMDVHVDAVRATGYSPAPVMLSSFNAPLTATVRLVDPEPTHAGVFDINGLSMGAPLNITVIDGDPSSAVTIRARAEDADARVRLDRNYEGGFMARVLEPSKNTRAHVSARPWVPINGSVEEDASTKKVVTYTVQLPHELSGSMMWNTNPWGLPPYRAQPDTSHVISQSLRGSAYIEF